MASEALLYIGVVKGKVDVKGNVAAAGIPSGGPTTHGGETWQASVPSHGLARGDCL